MNTIQSKVMAAVMLLASAGILRADPVGTAFTYQGHLSQDGQAVNGSDCYLSFSLFDAAAAGNQVGATLEMANVEVVDGTFAVSLDFGAGAFPGAARWLEIAVDCESSGAAYVTLAPRQELQPAPYAIGLSLPYSGADDDAGNVFSVSNTGMGRAGNFQIDNPANPEAALNAVTVGANGLAIACLNDSGGDALEARATGNGTAAEGLSEGGTGVRGVSIRGIGVHGRHTDTSDSNPAVLGETDSRGPSAFGVHGRVNTEIAGPLSAGVRGTNNGRDGNSSGVWGSHNGKGIGVYGTANETNSIGVSGDSQLGIGVRGTHLAANGTAPGVMGRTSSVEPSAKGVHGQATGTGSAMTFGVYGESASVLGVGVYGQGNVGVYGKGNETGVRAEAGDSASFGLWALGSGGELSQPAIRADNFNGPGIFALGGRAIEGEGTVFGVRGSTWDEDGVGGSFTNFEGGLAIHADGNVEVEGNAVITGTTTTGVLEVTGADLAERFPVTDAVEPGMVVAIDPQNPGHLSLSRQAYNRLVAGVVSGANGLPAGTIMGNLPGHENAPAVALTGRVWVQCDATERAIEPGDLMTTAERPGHAMAAADITRAQGAIIGKAMTGLPHGQTGMVLVLVNLQ